VELAYQLLIYPCNDSDMNYDSAYNNGTGYGLSTQAMKWFWEQYLAKKSDAKNPYAVPVCAKDFSGLAPAIITTAEFDPLLDDGYIYAELLRKSGVQTIYREYEGVIHGYFTLAGVTPEAEVLHSYLADEINALLKR
jgi:acetyl esterase